MCDPFMYQLGDNMIMEMEGVGWLKGSVRGLVGMVQLNFLVAVVVPKGYTCGKTAESYTHK